MHGCNKVMLGSMELCKGLFGCLLSWPILLEFVFDVFRVALGCVSVEHGNSVNSNECKSVYKVLM